MRFYDPRDDARLDRLVAEGAIGREPLEAAVGNQSVGLLDALVVHAALFPPRPWISWGLREGRMRLAPGGAAVGFLRRLALLPEQRDRLADAWWLPFSHNAFGQWLVASVPGWDLAPGEVPSNPPGVVPCILTLSELGVLKTQFLRFA